MGKPVAGFMRLSDVEVIAEKVLLVELGEKVLLVKLGEKLLLVELGEKLFQRSTKTYPFSM